MKYVITINDCGGNLTYYKAEQFNINMLTKEFINTHREIENETLNSMLIKDFSRNFKNAEIYKVYVHNNNLNYDNVIPVGYGTKFDFNIVNTKEIYKPEPKFIFINYDFISGNEIAFSQAMETEEEFETNCVTFFDFDNLAEYNDIIVRKENGDYISAFELLNNIYPYCEKEIRISHNISKMLIAGSFKFRKDVKWEPIVD